MKLLWIGKQATSGMAGDEIYDRKIISELERSGVEIARLAPVAVSKPHQILNYIRGVPHYRATYFSEANARRMRHAASSCDAAVISWEPLDCFLPELPIPKVVVLHNVTSQSLPALYPQDPVAAFLARQAWHWERRLYSRDDLAAVAVLARKDETTLRALGAQNVIYAPPGMPPCLGVDDDAVFRPELILEGTYDWRPKRRDAKRFYRELAEIDTEYVVRADNFPERAIIGVRPKPIVASRSLIRIGIVADRFKAGYKLKAAAYIAQNCFVFSYADIYQDFSALDDAAFFIRHIHHANDIELHARDISRMRDGEIRDRLRTFQSSCAEAFSWTTSAMSILRALQKTAGVPAS